MRTGVAMAETVWKPNTTVAALCEREGRYLLVRERVRGRIVYNQPAGHLEAGESLLDAVIRETLEETRYRFEPETLQGIYRFCPPDNSAKTYLRFLFRGSVAGSVEGELDRGIIAAEWMTYEEIRACRAQHRTPVVMQCIDDARASPGYPLDVISRVYA